MKYLVLILVIVLAACGQEKEDNQKPAPTATEAIVVNALANFDGPLLNPVPVDASEDCALDGSTECGVGTSPIIQENALPLPLTAQTLEGVLVGIPEDFEMLSFGNLTSIETTDKEKHPGEFRVLVQFMSALEVDRLLNSYANLDRTQRTDLEIGTLKGYTIPNGELGAVGVVELAEDQFLVLEGFVNPGYWPLYAATFNALFESIRPA